ncbi:MAG: hypothetical protein KAI81_01100, partial [Candidatus Marinimicrobia bacterium]|nr:hypothetical protein [Candidatus Neomarinimicrobiota bacterium]
MKTTYLRLIMMMLFVVSLGFTTKLAAQNDSTDVKTAPVKQMPKKPTGPMPAPSVYSHNGSIVPVGTYVA